VRAALKAIAPALAYGDQLPAASPRQIRGNLGSAAARLRRLT
jgi:hypothetical protein